MIFYHNPRCRKSREALELLRQRKIQPTVIEYLQHPLTAEELSQLSKKLGKHPREWVRSGEEEFKNHIKGKDLSDQEWYQAMEKFPKLMERPILVHGEKAVVGRPPTEILTII